MSIFYKVNNRTFSSKIEAITYANQTRSQVSWHFYEDIFSRVNWTVEPALSLDELYAARAQEIREQYDYVVIMCSGGADSTNVVKTFINNRIHVDEVVASAPMSGLSKFKFNNTDTSHTNTISETKYAQMPLLSEISISNPEIKISVNDYFQSMLNLTEGQWLVDCDDWIHPSSAARYSLESLHHLKTLAEAGKRIAIVYGIDKPVIARISNGDLKMVFSDLAVNVPRRPFDFQYPNVDQVLFYWSHTMPELVVKQCHVLAKWIHLPENSNALNLMYNSASCFNESFQQQRERHSKYERAIVPAIYPSTWRKVFQAEKPVSLWGGEHDHWFYSLHNSTTAYSIIQHDLSYFYKKFHPLYLNSAGNGFEVYLNTYTFGKYFQFTR